MKLLLMNFRRHLASLLIDPLRNTFHLDSGEVILFFLSQNHTLYQISYQSTKNIIIINYVNQRTRTFSIAQSILLLMILSIIQVFAETPAKADSAIVDTIYVIQESGIPWNREHFDPERLIRHDTFDPALKVAYTYSVSFIGGSFGSFAQQSFMAHFAYEFTPDLHLYANVGLWMPLYYYARIQAKWQDDFEGHVHQRKRCIQGLWTTSLLLRRLSMEQFFLLQIKTE